MTDTTADSAGTATGESASEAGTTAAPPDAPRCPYCGEPFPSGRLRDLHRGLEHYDRLDADERDAYQAAYRDEAEDLRSFRLRALAVLVLLYFGFLMTYAVVAV